MGLLSFFGKKSNAVRPVMQVMMTSNPTYDTAKRSMMTYQVGERRLYAVEVQAICLAAAAKCCKQ